MEVEDLPSDEPSTGSVDDKTSDRRLQSYLTCDPPSSSTNENMTDPLKVAFWDKTESALCKDITEDGVTMTNARMAEICSDFCTPTAVPFLLGTTSFGFTHTQLDSVCLSPEDENVLYSAESVNTCHEKANSFRDLQMSTSYFASALQVLDASKIRFEAEAKQAAEGLKTLIRDQAKTVLDNAARSQKIVELETLMQTGLEDILVNGVVKRQLKEDALRVKDRATTLQTDLARVLPDVQAFLTECNIMTTGVGPSDEYLLDMCSQTSTQCVGAEEGVHVGCCCGYNPVVTLGTSGVARGTPTIAGIGDRNARQTWAGGGYSRTGRRLQDQASINICAEAGADSAARIEGHRDRVRELGREDLILRRECERRQRYQAFYEGCAELDCSSVAHLIRSAAPSPGAPAPAVVTTSGAVSKDLSVMMMATILLIYARS